MKKYVILSGLLGLVNMNTTPLLAKKVSSKTSFSETVVATVKSAWMSTKTSVSTHPYRSLGIVCGVSLFGYILYLYRAGLLSCDDVKAFFGKWCSCTKKVDKAKAKS